MNAPAGIEAYRAALDGALGHPRGARARRAMREIADHLEDAASALEADGRSRAEAEREACARFGSARTTARNLVAANVLAGETPLWLAAPLWAGLALSVSGGGLFTVMASIHSGLGTAVMEAAVMAATLAAAILFARLHLGAGALGRPVVVATLVLALALLGGGVALGIAATVAGLQSGDMEYYLVLRAGLLAGTGLLGTVTVFAGRLMHRPD